MTRIAIVQNAMIHAGLIPIESFEDGSEIADSAARLYETHRRALLGHINWKFADLRAQLSNTGATPAAEWSYEFRLPANRILPPHAIFTSGDPRTPLLKNFEIGTDKLYANVTPLWCAYTGDVDEAIWPPYFVDFAEHAFAAAIGGPGGATDAKVTEQHRIAWGSPGEGMRGGLSATARSADGKNSPTRSLIRGQGPLLQARRGGR